MQNHFNRENLPFELFLKYERILTVLYTGACYSRVFLTIVQLHTYKIYL